VRALAEVEVGRGEKDLRCKSLFIVCQRRRDYQKMKRSYEFMITRCFMQLFRTGFITVVTDCQKFSHFLPVTYQIDILTVKCLQKFQSSDNHICNLFSKKAEVGVKNVFYQYGSQINNVYDLKKL